MLIVLLWNAYSMVVNLRKKNNLELIIFISLLLFFQNIKSRKTKDKGYSSMTQTNQYMQSKNNVESRNTTFIAVLHLKVIVRPAAQMQKKLKPHCKFRTDPSTSLSKTFCKMKPETNTEFSCKKYLFCYHIFNSWYFDISLQYRRNDFYQQQSERKLSIWLYSTCCTSMHILSLTPS